VAGCCEHGDEFLRSAKLEEFVPLLSTSQLLTYNLLHGVRRSVVLVNCGVEGITLIFKSPFLLGRPTRADKGRHYIRTKLRAVFIP
jgi:hypothetical protein